MRTGAIDLVAFAPQHIEEAITLSRQAKWPHRSEDWHLVLELSAGAVALDDEGKVAGTILMTPYGSDCATISMVIVDECLRGRGIGRKLMEKAFALAGNRQLRLIATMEGLPLYEKLGFVACGTIDQHQGRAHEVAEPAGVEPANAGDLVAIKALDGTAFGADRSALIDLLARNGAFAVIRRGGAVVAYAACRAFGRGEVIGPVVAANKDDAKELIAFFTAGRAGAFLRIDTQKDSGLSGWLTAIGLAKVGGGIVMGKPPSENPEEPATRIFALANQALG
ncbi:GNAT family N-acetyltransferase [Rhizobium sp. YTU87027]|uniref:GNAT family N-acetyltransferase n=1 Tax=Rhizobium sp. YTU87027 TaxID=3417741 RepID=UPI003D6947AC